MCSSSVTGGFRQLQVIHDLSLVVQGASASTVARIADAIPGVSADAIATFFKSNAVLDAQSPDIADAIRLGAARPDEDFDAFVVCAAVLIRDRLSGGASEDGFYWMWESYHDQITTADPQIRAALVQGLRLAQINGLEEFGPPPFEEFRATRSANSVMDALEDMLSQTVLPRTGGKMSRAADPLGAVDAVGFMPAAAAVIYGVLQEPARTDVANALWLRHGQDLTVSEASWASTLVQAMRHVFETNDNFDPWPDADANGDVTLFPAQRDPRATEKVFA